MRLSRRQSSRLPLRIPQISRASGLPSQDPNVFTNDLRKTLEAHRLSNRASLIRKVYPRNPAAGLFRPYIPPENRAGYQAPEQPAPTRGESESSKPTGRKRSRRPSPNIGLFVGDNQFIHNPIQKAGVLPAQQPWLSFRTSFEATSEATAYLGTEVQALNRYLSPTAVEQTQIRLLVANVASLLERVVPQPPQLIGSRRTGLALAHSNVNLLLPYKDPSRPLGSTRGPSATRPQIQEIHKDLNYKVKSCLQNSPIFDDQVDVVGKRKLMVQARHRPTGLLLQFECGETVPLITEYMQDYLVEYPTLRPLYVGMRTLLEACNIFGRMRASIGSDALTLLIVAFLKINHGRYLGPERLGEQFLDLLRFYSTDVDLQSVGVAVDPPGIFEEKSLRFPTEFDEPAYLRGRRALIKAKRTVAMGNDLHVEQRLCIQDPTNYGRNIGSGCRRTSELRDCFASAYDSLVLACNNWQGSYQDNSLLSDAIQANFDELENFRRRIISPSTNSN